MELSKPAPKAGRWYRADGSIAEGATLREARKERLLPSVTSILDEKAEPGLEQWKIRQAVLAALTLPRNLGESAEDFAERVLEDAKAEAARAASIGTAVHAWLEAKLRGDLQPPPIPAGLEASCFSAWEWCQDNLGPGQSELAVVNRTMGYAGRLDWLGSWKEAGGQLIVDFKTQNVKGRTPVWYDKWPAQLAAYRLAVDGAPALVSVVVSTNQDNQGVWAKAWDPQETFQGMDIFYACFDLWRAVRGYNPAEAVD